MELHVKWGSASAHQLGRVLVDSDSGSMGLVNYADEAPGQFGIRNAVNKAPRLPIVGASAAPAFNEQLQACLPFSADTAALRVMGVYPKYSRTFRSALF